jgi:hypothetical protein
MYIEGLLSVTNSSRCHIKNVSCILPHYRQTLNNELKLAGSEACWIVGIRMNLFWWRQHLHFFVSVWTVDMAVLSSRRRTSLPLEIVLLEGLPYVQQSQYQNNYYLTWQNLINCSVVRILSLVRVTFRNYRNISREISLWGRNHPISRNDMRCPTVI